MGINYEKLDDEAKYTLPYHWRKKNKANIEMNWDLYTMRLAQMEGATATDWKLLCSLAQGWVLDAGCGIGKHLSRISALQSVVTAIGIDVGLPGLRYARLTHSNVHLFCANVYQLPFRDCTFDFVYSIDVIEHLLDPHQACRELYRVCKHNARIFIQTPNYPIKRFYDFWHRINGSRDSWKDDPSHVYKFNPWRLVRILHQVGFVVDLIIARNLPFQERIPFLKGLRKSIVGKLLGQKIIVIAIKP